MSGSDGLSDDARRAVLIVHLRRLALEQGNALACWWWLRLEADPEALAAFDAWLSRTLEAFTKLAEAIRPVLIHFQLEAAGVPVPVDELAAAIRHHELAHGGRDARRRSQ